MKTRIPFRILPWLLLIPLLVLTTCKKQDAEPEQDVIISPLAKIITQQQWQQGIVAVDSATYTITISQAVAGTLGLNVGDIIIVPVGKGLIRKITAISQSGSNTVLSTSQAAITDAIEKGSFQFKKDLSASVAAAKIRYLADGVRLDPESLKGSSPELTFTLDYPIAEHVTLSGTLTIATGISGEAIIKDQSLEYFKMEFTLEETFELTATTTLAQINLEKEVEIAKIDFPTITVMVGMVPVLITPTFSLTLGASLDLKSELTAGITQNLVVTSGVEYTNGTWNPYFDLTKSLGHSGPSLSNTLEAKIYIEPKISMLFYKVVSPYLKAQLYGLVEADLAATPWWKVYAGLSSDIGVEMKIWKFSLIDFSQNLFDLKILIADAGGTGNSPPVASLTVQPQSGNSATFFQFDASGCTDPEESTSSLNVRWDWNGDGSWDTPYSTVKTEKHQFAAGSHFIVMEVKDNVGATDTASVHIQVEEGNQTGDLTDPRDGHIYTTVKIGDRWWMAQNLNYGTRILAGYLQKDNDIPEKFCYNNDESYCDMYGGLYQWGEAMQYDTVEITQGICPPGWHIPSVTEWDELIAFLGGDTIAGGALKLNGTAYWDEPNTGATNSSGFAALGAGTKVFSNSIFHLEHQQTEFWTSYFDKVYYGTKVIALKYNNGGVTRFAEERREGISVRCVMD